jgi:hypothetical protein
MAQERRWARVLGLLALIAGVLGAAGLWWAAERRYDDAVGDLAPAPAGCDTTLDFDRTGTFTFFLESKGELEELAGDCERAAGAYELDGEESPRVQLTLVDAEGEELDLDRADGPSYDRNGSAGEGIRVVDIDDAGEYVLTVESESDEVVVRVGRDPAAGVGGLRLGAVAALVIGVGLGIAGLVAGRRRDLGEPRPMATETWPQIPARPPIAPPTMGGPTPPYATPPGGRPLPPPTYPQPTPPRPVLPQPAPPRRPLPPPSPPR